MFKGNQESNSDNEKNENSLSFAVLLISGCVDAADPLGPGQGEWAVEGDLWLSSEQLAILRECSRSKGVVLLIEAVLSSSRTVDFFKESRRSPSGLLNDEDDWCTHRWSSCR